MCGRMLSNRSVPGCEKRTHSHFKELWQVKLKALLFIKSVFHAQSQGAGDVFALVIHKQLLMSC